MQRTAEKRFVRHVRLRLRHPFPPFLFGMFPYNLNVYHKLEDPESSTLRQLCTMVASCPSFVAATEKDNAEKQRVLSRSCGLQDLLQCSDCALNCAM